MITVYYDGSCGLCAKEISYYKHVAPGGVFVWDDIAHDASAFVAKGYVKSDGLKTLHAEDHQGVMHQGVDAFILIWKQLKYWKLLAFLAGLPIAKQIAQFLYNRFATWRFKRLTHCQLALQEKDS